MNLYRCDWCGALMDAPAFVLSRPDPETLRPSKEEQLCRDCAQALATFSLDCAATRKALKDVPVKDVAKDV